MIFNLHGFNSAGNNNTADQLKRYFGTDIEVISPTYTVHNFSKGFSELSEIVSKAVDSHSPERLLFVGSSTGAVFAEMLAQKFHGNVVAINPVTNPGILVGALGWNENFRTGKKYEFTATDLKTFNEVVHDMTIARLVLVEKDDPIINHAKTRDFYADKCIFIEYAGDSHRFSFWGEGLPEIQNFIAQL